MKKACTPSRESRIKNNGPSAKPISRIITNVPEMNSVQDQSLKWTQHCCRGDCGWCRRRSGNLREAVVCGLPNLNRQELEKSENSIVTLSSSFTIPARTLVGWLLQ